MEFFKEIGAYAGRAAFLGLAVLALLYFAQARDVRRLRESASFLVEGPEPGEAPEPEPATATQARPATQAKGKAPTAAPRQPTDAEAFRRAELARQAAQRRERFENRRGGSRMARGGEGRFSRLPEPRALVVIVVGAALLLAGVAFGATRILGGDDGAGGGGRAAGVTQTKVTVLNSTATPGLAAKFKRQLLDAGYTSVDATNTAIPFETSEVMFEPKGAAAAREIGRLLKMKTGEMLDQVRPDAAGNDVAVVIGEDKAG
jgi:hypothetical protein